MVRVGFGAVPEEPEADAYSVALEEGRRAIDDVVTFVELTRYARPRELSEDTRAQIEKNVETWRSAVYAFLPASTVP